jgi:hypothetical protein
MEMCALEVFNQSRRNKLLAWKEVQSDCGKFLFFAFQELQAVVDRYAKEASNWRQTEASLQKKINVRINSKQRSFLSVEQSCPPCGEGE